jgi:hypothetical protein
MLEVGWHHEGFVDSASRPVGDERLFVLVLVSSDGGETVAQGGELTYG